MTSLWLGLLLTFVVWAAVAQLADGYRLWRAHVTTEESHPPGRRFWRFVIRDRDSDAPYLTRWSLKLLRGWILRLHVIDRPDSTRCVHDHPWPFWTFCLWGGYAETIEEDSVRDVEGIRTVVVVRREHHVRPRTLHYRPAAFRHTITALPRGRAITLVLTGPRIQSWGFYTTRGFRPYWDFLARGKAVRALWCRD